MPCPNYITLQHFVTSIELPDSYLSCCYVLVKKVSCKSDSMCAPAGNGKKEIDVVGYFKDQTHLHWSFQVTTTTKNQKICFFECLATAAAEVDIHLVIRASAKKKVPV